jgi:hypothetical protein
VLPFKELQQVARLGRYCLKVVPRERGGHPKDDAQAPHFVVRRRTMLLAPLQEFVDDGDERRRSNIAKLRLLHQPVRTLKRSGLLFAKAMASALQRHITSPAGLPKSGTRTT